MSKKVRNSLGVLVVVLFFFFAGAPAPLVAQDEGRSTDDRIELGIHGGGVFTTRFDFFGRCTPVTQDGCDADEGDFDGETTDVFFAAAGDGLSVNSGALVGLRLGVDVTSRWQIEFTWDHAFADMAFENESLRVASVGVEERDDNAIINEGAPQGFMNIYQFNLNYHTRETGTVVPYVGGGAGWVQFADAPTLEILEEGSDDLGVVRLDEDTAFAFNVGLGVKIYPRPSFGVCLEARQLFSFYRTTHTVRTFDDVAENGLTELDDENANANFRQRSTFGHLALTAGVFWRF